MSGVLVTGGAGFVGSHLVDALLARGERVRVIDNLDPLGHPDGEPAYLDPQAELVVGDLCDRRAVERALDGIDRVFHLGGAVGNGESMVNARRAVDANVGGTATLLEAVVERRDRIRRLVSASSMAVYGEGCYECPGHGTVVPPPRPLAQLRRREWEPRCPSCAEVLQPAPTSEGAPLRPTNVYGATKRAQEELVLVLARAYGLEAVVLRYLNVYGPRQALANPYTGVAAIFAARLLNGRPPLVFEDGRQIRDLVHVADVVRATLAAMDAPAGGYAINVAGGRRITVLELASRLASALGSRLDPHVTGEFRAGDIRHCFADVTLARELLDFEATRMLDDELPALCEWVAAQRVRERGDEAVAELRTRGLVA